VKGYKDMTRKEIIKKVEEIKELLLTEVETDELTDYAREHAYYSLCGAVDYLKENEE
jgi:hypothetical protein